MATLVALTMAQGNDEVVDVTITPVVSTDDLTLVTELIFYMKPDTCTADTASTVTTLSSANPAQITITAQTAVSISATVYVPASALVEQYNRVWRIDALSGTTVRTALYGPINVIDL